MARNTPTLKEIRMALGLTQKQSAAIAKVTPKTLGGWERGENISPKNIGGAALAYQCTIDEVQAYWAKSKAAVKMTKRRIKRTRKKIKTAC